VQRQGQLLPAFVDDALDPSDPVFFIDDVVDGLELTALERRYAPLGEHAYDPRLLLKLWLYGATQGVYSGRELARRVRRDLAFRYLAGDGPVPDFRTMHRFRVRHREDFAAVLRATVRLAQGAGLVRLGLVAIDGTKLRANTSRAKALSHQRMVETEARLEAGIAAVLQRLDAVHAAEDAEHDEDDEGSGGLPVELQDRQRRLARLQTVRAQLEREKGEALTPKHQKSGRDDDDGRGPRRRADGQGVSERGESRDAAGAGTGMSDRGGPRGQRGALAARRRDANRRWGFGAASYAAGRTCGANGTWSRRPATCAASSHSGSRRHETVLLR
jgi:transposase